MDLIVESWASSRYNPGMQAGGLMEYVSSALGRTCTVVGVSLGVLLALGSAGCVVPAPSPGQVAAANLDSPRATFETFVTAFQGDLLGHEYKCFSAAFRRRNNLTQHIYRDFREQLVDTNPRLRWALYRCEVEEVMQLDGRRAVLLALVPGVLFWPATQLRVDLVREDHYEVLANGHTLAVGGGGEGSFQLANEVLTLAQREGRLQLEASVELSNGPPEGGLQQVTRFCMESLWRIDALEFDDARID